jgi:hypothetical protein
MNNVPYSVLYANVQRNSYANSTIIASGERDWKKDYTTDFDEVVSPPTAILSRKSTVGIQVNPYFLIYENGTFKQWHYIRALSSGIGIFLHDFYLVIEDSGLDKFFKYDNSILRNDVPSTGLVHWWSPCITVPYSKGMLYANQFTGGPQRSRKEFVIGYTVFGNNLAEWYFGDYGEISNVLLNSTIDKLVFTFQNQIHTLDPATGKKIKVFDPELPSMFKASLDLSNNLVIHAINKDPKEVYTSFDLNGSKLWEHEIEGSVQNDQPPVCGEDGTVFYVSDSTLVCIKSGKILWKEVVFPCVDPLITSSKGNNIIIQSGFHIMAYNSKGTKKFSTLITKNMNESFTAPPVVGGDGRIYVASGTALYCFK